jgi:hypothetical protein
MAYVKSSSRPLSKVVFKLEEIKLKCGPVHGKSFRILGSVTDEQTDVV